MDRIFGYARVSTSDQSLDLQVDELTKSGVLAEAIYSDVMSGSRDDRPGLSAVLAAASEGDTIVVWRLDRFGRSTLHLADLLSQLQKRRVRFRSLREGVDTGTAAGRMVFGVLSSLAEYERESIVERVRAGLAASKRRGVKLGRPRGLTVSQREHAAELQRAGKSYAAIGDLMGVSASTVYRNLAEVP